MCRETLIDKLISYFYFSTWIVYKEFTLIYNYCSISLISGTSIYKTAYRFFLNPIKIRTLIRKVRCAGQILNSPSWNASIQLVGYQCFEPMCRHYYIFITNWKIADKFVLDFITSIRYDKRSYRNYIHIELRMTWHDMKTIS